MDLWDFKKWRRKLRYSQFDAAEELGLSRAAVQNRESETVPISEVVELACEELTLRWKQRPEFGPVTLTYADEQVWPWPDQSARRLFVQCGIKQIGAAIICSTPPIGLRVRIVLAG